jgi:hypothetical protein
VERGKRNRWSNESNTETMKLYSFTNNKLKSIASNDFKLEKEIQNLVENTDLDYVMFLIKQSYKKQE